MDSYAGSQTVTQYVDGFVIFFNPVKQRIGIGVKRALGRTSLTAGISAIAHKIDRVMGKDFGKAPGIVPVAGGIAGEIEQCVGLSGVEAVDPEAGVVNQKPLKGAG